MITLFLDYDGVLHPEFCKASEHFKCLPHLESVLRRVPDCEIVISSSWRLTRPLPALVEALSAEVRMRVVGTTPTKVLPGELPESLMAYEREAECHAWLRAHERAHLPWLAIDDRAWLFKPFNRNVYLVDGRMGLREEDVGALIAHIAPPLGRPLF